MKEDHIVYTATFSICRSVEVVIHYVEDNAVKNHNHRRRICM